MSTSIESQYRFALGALVVLDSVPARVIERTWFKGDLAPHYRLSTSTLWVSENSIAFSLSSSSAPLPSAPSTPGPRKEPAMPTHPATMVRSESREGTRYRIYDNGSVIAYGPEHQGPRPDLWRASLWSAHPLDNVDAMHLGHLACDATWSELWAHLGAWERGERDGS